MLTFARLVVAATAMTAIAACGNGGASIPAADAHTAVGPPSAPPTTPPAPMPSPGVEIVEGAMARVQLGRTGWLDVSVKRIRTTKGTTTTVRYERSAPCGTEHVDTRAVIVNCPMVWEERRELADAKFVFDPLLNTASLTDTLRGARVKIEWAAIEETQRRPGGGHLLLESRDAETDGRWRGYRTVWREAPSSLYRRHTTTR